MLGNCLEVSVEMLSFLLMECRTGICNLIDLYIFVFYITRILYDADVFSFYRVVSVVQFLRTFSVLLLYMIFVSCTIISGWVVVNIFATTMMVGNEAQWVGDKSKGWG